MLMIVHSIVAVMSSHTADDDFRPFFMQAHYNTMKSLALQLQCSVSTSIPTTSTQSFIVALKTELLQDLICKALELPRVTLDPLELQPVQRKKRYLDNQHLESHCLV